MPVYEYTALDRAGKNVSGIIDADSMVVARQKLTGIRQVSLYRLRRQPPKPKQKQFGKPCRPCPFLTG